MIKSLMLATSIISAFGIGAISIDPYLNDIDKSLQDTIYVNNTDLVPQQEEAFNQGYTSWRDVNLNLDCNVFYPDYAWCNLENNNFSTLHVYLNFDSEENVSYNDTLNAISSQNTYLYLYNQNYYSMHLAYQLNTGDDNICVWVGIYKSTTYFNVIYFVSSDNNVATHLSNYRLNITTMYLYGTDFEGEYYNDYSLFSVTPGNAIYSYSTSTSNGQVNISWFTDISIANLTTPGAITDSYQNGYTNGYNDGLYANNMSTSLMQVFLTIGDIPMYIIHQMFSFDVLGTTLFLGLIFLSCAGVIVWVVKKCLGK